MGRVVPSSCRPWSWPPPCTTARTRHRPGYGARAYVTRHELAVEGPIREYYLVGQRETADESRWRTRDRLAHLPDRRGELTCVANYRRRPRRSRRGHRPGVAGASAHTASRTSGGLPGPGVNSLSGTCSPQVAVVPSWRPAVREVGHGGAGPAPCQCTRPARADGVALGDLLDGAAPVLDTGGAEVRAAAGRVVAVPRGAGARSKATWKNAGRTASRGCCRAASRLSRTVPVNRLADPGRPASAGLSCRSPSGSDPPGCAGRMCRARRAGRAHPRSPGRTRRGRWPQLAST